MYALHNSTMNQVFFSFTSNRSNVYAISRNSGEPALAKMTPIMPTAVDSNDEVSHVDPAVARHDSEQVHQAALRHCCHRFVN